uniref:Integrase core domain containing protein n=1 Tax=Solanum tuberosum TaxID=4113 RepID=M1DVR6_SOLTU
MAKIMTQLDILSKNVMGAGARSVNAMGVGCSNPEEMKFEALYNEKVYFLANQDGGYHSNYPREDGNQGWARDEGWKYRDREWRDQNPNWKDGEKDRYVPPHERQKPKDSEGGRFEDMLSRILNKVEGELSPEGKDQVGEKREQSTHHREIPRSSTMSPNDPDHDDAEGWCKTMVNYTKRQITELIIDSD